MGPQRSIQKIVYFEFVKISLAEIQISENRFQLTFWFCKTVFVTQHSVDIDVPTAT